MSEFIGAKDAAKMLGIHVNILYQYCAKDILPYHRPFHPKGKLYFRVEELKEFLSKFKK